MVDEIKVILDITKTRPQSKRECFLKFAALNRLNALVKKDVYKGVIKYWQIKPKVYELVKAVFEAGHREFFDAIYWATVSLTTVGYGDIYPVSTAGRIITMISSMFGIAVVALPAGIITAGYMDALNEEKHKDTNEESE